MNKFNELLKQLNAIEIVEFKNYLLENIINTISSINDNARIIEDNVTIRICPKCGLPLNKNGHTKTGVQKYICKECKQTISSTTGTVSYHSKKDFSIWKRVIDLSLDNLSIRKIASRLNISTRTVFNMRHKIFNSLTRFLDKQKLKGQIQGDEEYKSINLKGTKPNNMPRLSKKRKSSSLSGISHHKVCITSMLDCYDHIRMKIAGLGPASTDMIEKTMGNHVIEKSLLITDSKSSYLKFCENHNLKLEQIPSGFHNTDNFNNIQELNSVHSQLNIWLSKFRGVSTKHLQGYLDWFCYIFMLSKSFEEDNLKVEMYKDIIVNAKYIKVNDICSKSLPIDLYTAYSEYRYGIFA